MTGITVTMRMRELRFSAGAVRRYMDPVKREALMKAGAFVRTAARDSIRKRKGTSKPGSPPHSHAGHLRRLLLFAVDRQAETVVIGPLPFKEAQAPALLEAGGQTVRRVRYRSGRSYRRRLTYRRRPFMGPAADRGLAEAAAKTGNPLIRAWMNARKGGG